jgi:16S rRNA (cytosine967-C5)-methyltransferase
LAKEPRQTAFDILFAWERDPGLPIDEILGRILNKRTHSSEEKRWIMELVYGATRQQLQLDAYISRHYKGQYQKAQHALKVLLRMGCFQLIHMQTPDHAAINEMVNLARKVKMQRSAGLMNAILRQVSKQSLEALLSDIEDPIQQLAIKHSHPQWMLRRWQERYPLDTIQLLCQRNNQSPDQWIRRNALSVDQKDFEHFLEGEKMVYEHSAVLPEFYRLEQIGTLIHTPEFKSGWFSFQDLAAGMVAALLEPHSGDLIIDACAAPGGKMAYLAELGRNQIEMVACDASPKRLEKVLGNIERLHLQKIQTLTLDAAVDALPVADKILLDVPCTGTGVLSRRPDSRWRKQEGDLLKLNQIQQGILINSWKSLKAGGLLVYATCSLEPEENWDLIEMSLEQLEGSDIEPIDAENLKPYIDARGALSTLPWAHKMDGMFAVKIRKK